MQGLSHFPLYYFKKRYPIPLVSETIDRLSKARYLTKVDVTSTFNRMKIAEGDE